MMLCHMVGVLEIEKHSNEPAAVSSFRSHGVQTMPFLFSCDGSAFPPFVGVKDTPGNVLRATPNDDIALASSSTSKPATAASTLQCCVISKLKIKIEKSETDV